MRILKFLVLLSSFHFVLPSLAQDKDLIRTPIAATPAQNKIALVIGVNDYQNGIKPLHMCVNDARNFNQFLHDSLKFPSGAVTLLTDEPGNRHLPMKTTISREIRGFLAAVDADSEVIFYFSGHGARFNNQDWLVPLDADPDDIPGSCINYNDLRNALETKNPRRVLLVVDACRNLLDGKALGGSGFGESEGSRVPQFAELRSCQPKERSMEAPEFQGGVFTHFLLQGLKGEAAETQNGNVTFKSLSNYVRGNVRQYVREKYEDQQNPIGFATTGEMVLTHVSSASETPLVEPINPTPVLPKVPNLLSPAGELKLGSIKINPQDGAEMVYVPGGEFIMGSTDEQREANLQLAKQFWGGANPGMFLTEGPQRKIHVDGYWIYKTEVTVAQYRRFCNATGRAMPPAPSWGWKETHPIVNVTWDDCDAYSIWARVSLPTEAQWEKAARGTDGRLYIWGNEWPPQQAVGNCADKACKQKYGFEHADASFEDGFADTSPVGSFPAGASPCGALDMTGNVWEWCDGSVGPYSEMSSRNPKAALSKSQSVVRGCSWHDNIAIMRTSFRFLGWTANDYTGFRCVSVR